MASLAPRAHAADTTANVIKVSPVRSDIQVNPGESHTVKVTVTNLTNGTVSLAPIENDFIAGNQEDGQPFLILDANKTAPTHSLKKFMQPIDNFTIDAGAAKTIDVVINVPKNAQAGGYFGAIRFAPTTPDGGGQVNLSISATSLILLTVTGDTVEHLNLTDFNIQQNNKSDAFFTTPNDITTNFRFQNTGNLQESPVGKITVTKGKTIVYDVDFNNNTPKDVVLPDSARKWTVPLKNIGDFGHYTVNMTVSYGKDNSTVEVTKSFWVVPLWLMITAGAVLLALIVAVVIILASLARRRKRVLRDQERGRL